MSPPPLPPPAALDAVLFDLGGVLVRVHMERFFHRLAPRLRERPADLGQALFAESEYHRFARGEIDASAFHASLERQLGLQWPYPDFADAWCDVFDEVPESVSAVRLLHGRKPLFVLSNTDPLHFERIRRDGDWLRCFDGFHLSFEQGCEKPDPLFYRRFLDASGLRAERCLFFDDLAPNVEAARAAGLQAVQQQTADTALRVVADWPAG